MRFGNGLQSRRLARLEAAHVAVEDHHGIFIVYTVDRAFAGVRHVHHRLKCRQDFVSLAHQFFALEGQTNLLVDLMNLIPTSLGRRPLWSDGLSPAPGNVPPAFDAGQPNCIERWPLVCPDD